MPHVLLCFHAFSRDPMDRVRMATPRVGSISCPSEDRLDSDASRVLSSLRKKPARHCMVSRHHLLVSPHRDQMAETASQRLGSSRHDERKQG
jgi:hypothetical protein